MQSIDGASQPPGGGSNATASQAVSPFALGCHLACADASGSSLAGQRRTERPLQLQNMRALTVCKGKQSSRLVVVFIFVHKRLRIDIFLRVLIHQAAQTMSLRFPAPCKLKDEGEHAYRQPGYASCLPPRASDWRVRRYLVRPCANFFKDSAL